MGFVRRHEGLIRQRFEEIVASNESGTFQSEERSGMRSGDAFLEDFLEVLDDIGEGKLMRLCVLFSVLSHSSKLHCMFFHLLLLVPFLQLKALEL